MKAILYCRVSTDEQADGRTMEPYRAMMEQINNGEAHDYWQDVMSKLS